MIEVSTWVFLPKQLEAFQWTGQICSNSEFDQFPIWLNSRKHQMHITGACLHFVNRHRTNIAHATDWVVRAPDGPLVVPNEAFQAWVSAWLPASKGANLHDPASAVETHVIRGGAEVRS